MFDKKNFSPVIEILVGLLNLDDKDRRGINRLLKQLSPSAGKIGQDGLAAALYQPHFRLILLKDQYTDEVVGMASLHFSKTLMSPDGVGRIEDVVVDERYRGLGLGDLLMKYLIAIARWMKLSKLELTSGPRREAANRLYVKYGFVKRETNCYRLDLN